MPAVTFCDIRYGGRAWRTWPWEGGSGSARSSRHRPGPSGLSQQALASRWTLPAPAEPDGEVSVRAPDGCARVGSLFAYRAIYIACYAKGFAAAVAAVQVAG